MKRRLAELAQPPPAVLSHGALNLAALYRSISQVKKRSVRRRRSKVSAGSSCCLWVKDLYEIVTCFLSGISNRRVYACSLLRL